MTALIPFSFDNKSVRSTLVDGEPWFVARDVCAALHIGWRGDTLDAIKAEWRGMRKYRTPQLNQHGRTGTAEQELAIISEPAVYKLAFRSRKAAAERFTDWLASEVLPAIRKTGAYDAEAGQWEPHPHNPELERHKTKPGLFRPTAAAREAHMRIDGAAKALTAAEIETAMRMRLSNTRFLTSIDFDGAAPRLTALTAEHRIVNVADEKSMISFLKGLNEPQLSLLSLFIWGRTFGKDGLFTRQKAEKAQMNLLSQVLELSDERRS